MRTGSRLLVCAALALVAAACASDDPIARRVEQTQRTEQVFASSERFSPRRLDSLDLGQFLEARPAYRPDSAAIADFYARRDAQYAWLADSGLTSNAEAFIALAGLGAGPVDTLDVSCAHCPRDAELWLTAEFLQFARRDYGGHFARDPRELQWFIPRAKKDYTRLLDSLAAGTMDLRDIEPMHPQYALLREALGRLRGIADVPWEPLVLPSGTRRVAFGDSVDLVSQLRARLTRLGDYTATDSGARFDSALVYAVQRFQRRHGLTDDGIVGAGMLRALNVPPAQRLRTILVNMERLRWVPDRTPDTAIIVNIPAYELTVIEHDTDVLRMGIVVGAKATETAIFADSVSSVTFSPTWTVPESITRKEILPAMRRDPRYLARNRMDIIGGSRALPIIRQRPGPSNALGLVKFSFPNSFGIYMHDTPARGLFALERRAFSHGCIRLAQPLEMARYLLRSDTTWTAERMQTAMQSGVETVVPLAKPVPVFIVYFTAWVDREGRVNFRDDVYGHDARLAAELFASGVAR